MIIQTHIVNLDLPPNERWAFLKDYKEEIDELLAYYLEEFSEAEVILESVGQFKDWIVSAEIMAEIESIASISRFSANEILTANLYYDILKFYFGCTAFAIHTGEKMLHARNLDWHTENNMLSKYSSIFDFQKGGKTLFKSVGWLGFVGVLSGTKTNAFTVTLNAVLSDDAPELGTPITFLLRQALEKCDSFESAKALLAKTTIACDCLLLLSGKKSHEMVVIERTPKRSYLRTSKPNYIAVTNDYKGLDNVTSEGSVLQSTSCGRFDRACELASVNQPKTAAECLQILKDDSVMMGITVQQMVFDNETGDILAVKTEG